MTNEEVLSYISGLVSFSFTASGLSFSCLETNSQADAVSCQLNHAWHQLMTGYIFSGRLVGSWFPQRVWLILDFEMSALHLCFVYLFLFGVCKGLAEGKWSQLLCYSFTSIQCWKNEGWFGITVNVPTSSRFSFRVFSDKDLQQLRPTCPQVLSCLITARNGLFFFLLGT